ncbi:hypothetical protein ACFRCG_33495 [Embleya sp. NPDC056575]|uniref:hypothetical protein n=1 Tax=unclassified Embleya TaxID=2699296 RepID=UPI00367E5309
MLPPTPAEDQAVAARLHEPRRSGAAGPRRPWAARRIDPYDAPDDGPENDPGPALDAYETPIPAAEAAASEPTPDMALPGGPAERPSPNPDAVVAAHASRILDHLAGIALVDGGDPAVTLVVLGDVATAVETIQAGAAHARRTRPAPRQQ